MAFTFATGERGACRVLAPSGEVDVYTAPVLRQRLVDLFTSGSSCVIVDFENIEFIDSTGLGILVGALRRARSQGATLTLSGLSRSSRKVFEVTGLDRVFAIFESVDDAVADHEH